MLVTTIDAQWEGMGGVGSARYEPALLPPMPDHKGFKLQQLVNFQKFSTLRVNTIHEVPLFGKVMAKVKISLTL